MIHYVHKVLDALEILNGASHAEVILTNDGPCLVEVGSRCHGGEGSWMGITNSCYGYNQLQVNLDCYLRPDQYDNIPPLVSF